MINIGKSNKEIVKEHDIFYKIFEQDHLSYNFDEINKDILNERQLIKKQPYKIKNEFKPLYNIIVIIIESFRADIITKQENITPFVKSLITESYYFPNSFASSSHSNYSDISFWYSQYPLRTLNFQNYANSIIRGISVFKIFEGLGYETAYISSQNEKWGNMINWLDVPEVHYFFHSEDYNAETWVNIHDKRGLISLIEKKVASAGKIEDSATLKIAMDWIETLDKDTNFFLGMNLQNTHYHYIIPPGGSTPFKPCELDFPTVFSGWPENKKEIVYNRFCNSLFNVDSLLAKFVSYLHDNGIWDNTFMIILGDSGEAFYEHGFCNHSGQMYNEVANTLTLIRTPPGFTKEIIQNAISHIDIFPTLLDILNVPVPHSFQGKSVFDYDGNVVFLHSHALVHQDGIIRWPWKLLINHSAGDRIELYNLYDDPTETEELSYKNESVTVELEKKLIEWRKVQLAYYTYPEYYLQYEPPRFY